MDDLTGLLGVVTDMFKDNTSYSIGWTALGLIGIFLAKKIVKFILAIILFMYIAFKVCISSNLIDLSIFLQ